MTRPSSYLIGATPRSGSTLLCGLLQSTGVAGRPESYFRVFDEATWAERWQLLRDSDRCFRYTDYVSAAVVAGSTRNGVFAARIMWGTMADLVARIGTAYPDIAGSDLDLLTRAFGDTHFVHLRRDDTVAQAVSWTRAEQTNFWHPADGNPSGVEPRFDVDQISAHVRTIQEHNAAWRSWFAALGIRAQDIGYEQLVADMAGVTGGILDALGIELPPGRAIRPRDSRQADEINRDWIVRYRAIAAAR